MKSSIKTFILDVERNDNVPVRSTIADSENYQVAIRQLGLMDSYIKKFLLLSKSPETNEYAEVS